MQIFLTSPDYAQCARDLDDVRLRKIIVESAQIASTALWINNCDLAETLTSQGLCYLPSHENRPLVKWAASDYEVFRDCLRYCQCLCDEYFDRFYKKHKTFNICMNLVSIALPKHFKKYEQWVEIVYVNATTNHKHIHDVYEAYRQELCLKWKNDKKPPIWTNRQQPHWYKGE